MRNWILKKLIKRSFIKNIVMFMTPIERIRDKKWINDRVEHIYNNLDNMLDYNA